MYCFCEWLVCCNMVASQFLFLFSPTFLSLNWQLTSELPHKVYSWIFVQQNFLTFPWLRKNLLNFLTFHGLFQPVLEFPDFSTFFRLFISLAILFYWGQRNINFFRARIYDSGTMLFVYILLSSIFMSSCG